MLLKRLTDPSAAAAAAVPATLVCMRARAELRPNWRKECV